MSHTGIFDLTNSHNFKIFAITQFSVRRFVSFIICFAFFSNFLFLYVPLGISTTNKEFLIPFVR